jgi:hypothetical protein
MQCVDHSVLVVASQLDALADLFAYVECGHTSINQSNKQTNKQTSKQTRRPTTTTTTRLRSAAACLSE